MIHLDFNGSFGPTPITTGKKLQIAHAGVLELTDGWGIASVHAENDGHIVTKWPIRQRSARSAKEGLWQQS